MSAWNQPDYGNNMWNGANGPKVRTKLATGPLSCFCLNWERFGSMSPGCDNIEDSIKATREDDSGCAATGT